MTGLMQGKRGLIMGLATFSLFMMTLLLCFVPVETIHTFVDSVRSLFTGQEVRRNSLRSEPVRESAVTASPVR